MACDDFIKPILKGSSRKPKGIEDSGPSGLQYIILQYVA